MMVIMSLTGVWSWGPGERHPTGHHPRQLSDILHAPAPKRRAHILLVRRHERQPAQHPAALVRSLRCRDDTDENDTDSGPGMCVRVCDCRALMR
eukprot:607676-Rhodomonas_salina.2